MSLAAPVTAAPAAWASRPIPAMVLQAEVMSAAATAASTTILRMNRIPFVAKASWRRFLALFRRAPAPGSITWDAA